MGGQAVSEPQAVSDTTLGYEIFGPLWALVDLGAVASQPAAAEYSLTAFAAARAPELDRLREIVRDIGSFAPDVMAIFDDQGGWASPGPVSAEDLSLRLLMAAGFIVDYPLDLADAATTRRVLDAGRDLQLATLLHALVGTAQHRGPGLPSAAALIADGVRLAGELAGADPRSVLSDTVRQWRVGFLPAVLRPDSPSPAAFRAGVRGYDRALAELTAG